jgi:hypothetical protein
VWSSSFLRWLILHIATIYVSWPHSWYLVSFLHPQLWLLAHLVARLSYSAEIWKNFAPNANIMFVFIGQQNIKNLACPVHIILILNSWHFELIYRVCSCVFCVLGVHGSTRFTVHESVCASWKDFPIRITVLVYLKKLKFCNSSSHICSLCSCKVYFITPFSRFLTGIFYICLQQIISLIWESTVFLAR